MNMMRHPAPHRPQTTATSRPAAPPARAMHSGGASANKAGKTEELFMVVRQLSELLVKENAALKNYRTGEVQALAERKDRLAVLYQAHMFAIQRDRSVLESMDMAKRQSLAQLATRLADLMRDNASMLKANIRSIDTFFQAVNDAVREREEKKSASYSREGMMNSRMTTRRNLAVSFNQTT